MVASLVFYRGFLDISQSVRASRLHGLGGKPLLIPAYAVLSCNYNFPFQVPFSLSVLGGQTGPGSLGEKLSAGYKLSASLWMLT